MFIIINMKALLIAVLIILIILIIIIFFFDNIRKKNSIKETFYDVSDNNSGDIYYGKSLSDNMDKIEKDISSAIVKQEQDSRDFLLLQDTSKNQFSTLNTNINQYTSDTSSKIANVQNSIDLNNSSINTINTNIKDYDNKFKSINDNLAIIDGRSIIISKQQDQLTDLNSTLTNLSSQYSTFKDSINIQNQNLQNNVDAELYSFKNNVNNSFSMQESLINNTNDQIHSLSKDFGNFKSDNTNNLQQNNLNIITGEVSNLNSAIKNAQYTINTMSSKIDNSISKDQLNKFLLKSDMSSYATKVDEEKYATIDNISNYISRPELIKTINDKFNELNKTLSNLNDSNKNDFNKQNSSLDGRIGILESRNPSQSKNNTTDETSLSAQNQLIINNHTKQIINSENNINNLNSSVTDIKNKILPLQNSLKTLQDSLINYYNKTDIDNKFKTNSTNSSTSASTSTVSSETSISLFSSIDKLQSQIDKIKILSGPKGDTGPIGPIGQVGSKGDIGISGKDGVAGKDGVVGKDGPYGKTGNTGPKGDNGPSGSKGDTGPSGIGGLTGPRGNDASISMDPNFNSISRNDGDWLRIHGGDNGTAVYKGMSINEDGGLAIGSWNHVPQGTLDVTGDTNLHGKLQINKGVRIENNGLSIGGAGKLSVDAPNVPDGRFVVNDDSSVIHNNIKFSKVWSGYTDDKDHKDRAEISNDTGVYKSLMIVGNSTGKQGRTVSVYDTLCIGNRCINESSLRQIAGSFEKNPRS